MSPAYKFGTDLLDADGLMFAAELAFAGGLLEEMPADSDEAADAFQAIGVDVEEMP